MSADGNMLEHRSTNRGRSMAGQDGTGEARAAGVLTVIGSGETGPTVAPVYRRLRERAGTVSPALLLDTSYAFQANAAEITANLCR
jgi:hypothetical protein